MKLREAQKRRGKTKGNLSYIYMVRKQTYGVFENETERGQKEGKSNGS